MEGLTKQQLILLALLVSFVTSIATGIVTVSLMDQAPKSFSQTINRVVERTVEKVVAPSSTNTAAVATTKETIVVKADDMVVSAVEKNKGNLIRIIKIKEGINPEESFGALAISISKSGTLVTDISVLTKELDVFGSIIPESYKAVTSTGKEFPVVPIGVDQVNGLLFLAERDADGKPKSSLIMPPVALGDSDSLKLGQTVIAIGGKENNVVSTGIVASLSAKKDGSATNGGINSLIKTDVQFAEAVQGTILLNLSGEIVGILTGKNYGKSAFLPSNIVSFSVSQVEKTSKTNITF